MENIILEKLNVIIKEELSINNDVVYSSSEIGRNILNDTKKEWKGLTYDDKGKRAISFSKKYQFIIDGNEFFINFNITCLDYLSSEIYNRETENGKYTVDSMSIFKGKQRKPFMNVVFNYITIKNKPTNEFYQDLQHELNHLYQQYRNNGSYKDYLKYANIATVMNYNVNNIDSFKYKVARLLYLLNKTEQDSNVNGMYSFIKKSVDNNGNIDELFKTTKTYCILKESEKILTEIKQKSNDDELIKAVKMFDYVNVNEFVMKMKSLLKRFYKKIGKVLFKIKKEEFFNENVGIRINFGLINEEIKLNEPLFYSVYKVR